MIENPIAPATAARPSGTSELAAFITRLHFYTGLLVGPFLIIAALTGTLYVLTPQLEDWLYRDQLRTTTEGSAQSLQAQAEAARAHLGSDLRMIAVRPAPAPGSTTRVMFSDPALGDASRAVFVDPVSLDIRGELAVYGTSGTLPLRTTIDFLHRDLLLGSFGRHYSELAASWLWIVALGGVALWFWRRPRTKAARSGKMRVRRLHGLIGIWLAAGLVFLSITGLTWSRWAGGNIDVLRAGLGWVTPSVSLGLAAPQPAGGHEHADHAMASDAMAQPALPADPAGLLDPVLAAARAGGLDSPMLELRVAKAEGQAWLVREYDRSWPTQVDTVAVDPATMAITSRADFDTFPLIAKLIRWGIDAHMGILFGVANQILMAALGLFLTLTAVLGYVMWWQRRPAPGALPRTLVASWARLPAAAKAATLVLALSLGSARPGSQPRSLPADRRSALAAGVGA
jgi:uncharacterized iron-regulated membrane protein